MREIDDVAEIEDERQAKRHQHVERADDQPVGDVEQNDLRHLPLYALGLQREAADQVGCTILQPVSATVPAACSPGTSAATVNTSSASPFGGCTSPTKILGISS